VIITLTNNGQISPNLCFDYKKQAGKRLAQKQDVFVRKLD